MASKVLKQLRQELLDVVRKAGALASPIGSEDKKREIVTNLRCTACLESLHQRLP
jgi:hypothetical protein